MRDPITFAKLVSQVTHLSAAALDTFAIRELAETVDALAVGANADTVDRMLAAMQQGQKIYAIKEYRTLTGLGLKESKDAVEKYWVHREPPALVAEQTNIG